jgi:hypothetical protein
MSWVITGAQPFPAVIGEAFGGGYFAGYISHTADGNPTHALIVAPRAAGATGTGTGSSYTPATNLAWKTTQTTTANTTSPFDGSANTAAMVTAGIANHPAAQFCVNLGIGGFSDWYLPSKEELRLVYRNLGAVVPRLGNFGKSFYWTSSEYDLNNAWTVNFKDGQEFDREKWRVPDAAIGMKAIRTRPIRSFG